MLAVLFTTFVYIGLSMATALAPRASSVPTPYYRPARDCPTTDTQGLPLFGFVVPLNQPSATCVYAMGNCNFNQVTGDFTDLFPWCPRSAPVSSGCKYECPTSASTYPLSMVISQMTVGGDLQCTYQGSANTQKVCTYDSNGVARAAQSDPSCQKSLLLDCGATATKRRQYRSKDNYTAWLDRRTERQAVPAPRPLPGSVPRRR